MIIVVLLKYCPLVMLAMIIVVGSQFDISSLLPAQTGSDSCPNSFSFEAAKRENGQIRRQKDVI